MLSDKTKSQRKRHGIHTAERSVKARSSTWVAGYLE